MAPIWLKVNWMIINKSIPRRYLWNDFNIFSKIYSWEKPLSLNKIYTKDMMVSQCLYVRPSVHPSILTAPAETFQFFTLKR